jgi:hypothetical protein
LRSHLSGKCARGCCRFQKAHSVRLIPAERNVLWDGEMSPQAVAARLRLFGRPPPSLRLWLAAEQEGPPLDLSTLDGSSG